MEWTFISPLLRDIATLAVPSLYNIYFLVASVPIGFMLAVGLMLMRVSGLPVVSGFAGGFIYLFRGSPLFIQLAMFYALSLSLNLSLWEPLGIDWLALNPLVIGPLVLVLNTGAYSAEILCGAYRNVPAGEIEAARAFGMSRRQVYRTVIWPHLIRLAWPAYTNEVVFLFHATALVYLAMPVIDQQKDLMNAAGDLFEQDYNAFLHFPVAALYFLVITLAIFFIFGQVYKRMTRHIQSDMPKIRYAVKYLR